MAQSKYRIEQPMPKAKILNSIGGGIDLAGLGMVVADARYANMEVMGRINILEKYFPVCELGIGQCDRSGREQPTHFHSRAPYLRVGGDYCITKKRNGNRFLVGARYGFTKFDYDLTYPDFTDEVYGGTTDLNFVGLKAKSQWMEACIGVETKLWRFIRLGWTLRYKMKLSRDFSEHGRPWYTPGFGKTANHGWGGTVNLVFDFGYASSKAFDMK